MNMYFLWPDYTPPCSFCKKAHPEHTLTCRYYTPPPPPPANCECPQRKFLDGCHETWCPDWKAYEQS